MAQKGTFWTIEECSHLRFMSSHILFRYKLWICKSWGMAPLMVLVKYKIPISNVVLIVRCTSVSFLWWCILIDLIIRWTTYNSLKGICSVIRNVLARKLLNHTICGEFIPCFILYLPIILSHTYTGAVDCRYVWWYNKISNRNFKITSK